MGKALWLGAALVLAPSMLTGVAKATISDPEFTETVHLKNMGLAGMTVMAWAPDGSNRLFYARQNGTVRVFDSGYVSVFAGFSPVYATGECGVLGLAFDPNYVVNHYVYVFVTVSATEQQIVRFTDDGNIGKDKKVIVAGLPTRGAGHNAGSIGFGPDGKLYWSIGDLANQTGAGDDLSTVAGKVSRANLDGSAPADNPFFDGDGPNEDHIWARGFRNPFTFTWQPSTGQIWVNVVGTFHEQIFTPLAGDNAGWAKYENNQPAGYLPPTLSYPKTPFSLSIAAGGASRKAGVATFATTVPHALHLGTRVTIAGVTDASFNSVGYVTALPSPEAFSIAQVGPDAASGGGTETPIDLGNCVTGGAFWDSSAVPESYRGNFFFGDFVSLQIARATFAADSHVTSFDTWGTAVGNMIDMAVGPDGDMYYMTFQGQVDRVRYNAKTQGIVASSLHLQVPEAGAAAFGVRLAMAPSAPMTVAIARTSGDADVVSGVSELTFDAASWATPQAVKVMAADDDDAAPDVAELTLSAKGLPSEKVAVAVTDDDPLAIVVCRRRCRFRANRAPR